MMFMIAIDIANSTPTGRAQAGGGIGGQLVGLIGLGDAGGIIGTIARSTVGGAVLLFIVSLFKK